MQTEKAIVVHRCENGIDVEILAGGIIKINKGGKVIVRPISMLHSMVLAECEKPSSSAPGPAEKMCPGHHASFGVIYCGSCGGRIPCCGGPIRCEGCPELAEPISA